MPRRASTDGPVKRLSPKRFLDADRHVAPFRSRKIAYVVDAPCTPANSAKIVAIAQDADILFIEGGFRHADAALAAERGHLTAHQAGTLARLAGAKRLVTLHYSPRYQGQGEELAREAELAFVDG